MAKTVQTNLRLMPEHRDLIVDAAARLRNDLTFAVRLRAFLSDDVALNRVQFERHSFRWSYFLSME
jgi:uncharacterized protein (DUF1778 family)